MSKAIQGAAMLGGALALGAGLFFDPLLAFTPFYVNAMYALAAGGIAMEAGAIAQALSANRGTGITTRQPAANRQVILGEQRVGGISIYQSTTGSHHDQYNYVIVLAGHPCDSIVNLYLDGRRVYWKVGQYGNTTRNGVNFGGSADGNDHYDQGNNRYNFGGLVYCEARYGDQLPGDVISGLTANDPHWAASAQGSPYVGACTYVYLKVEYDTTMFPGQPEIRFTVRGNNEIYDPRNGTTGYSANWALCCAKVLTDPDFGLGYDQSDLNTAQLIAAANVCDEQVPLANGLTEARYTCNTTFDTTVAPGDMLERMMPAAEGRLSFIGGQFYLWPAYWHGPSLSFNEGSLLKDFQWNTARKRRDRFNRVRGTYTAPNYPYQVAGNLYDGNGFYDNTRQDNFQFEWQRTDFPYYAQDALHGYSTDPWLAADGGIESWENVSHGCVISVATAQRLAKIRLLRNRLGGGSGMFTMSLAAFNAQPVDVMQFTMAEYGWSNKLLEVVGVRFKVDASEGNAAALYVELDVQETDPSIYEWSPSEELTPAVQPAALTGYSYNVAAPTAATSQSNPSTALVSADGTVRQRIGVTWTAPSDAYVSQVQVQIQLVGSTQWLDAGMIDAGNTATYLQNVVPGSSYNVRIRSVTPRGAVSSWVQLPSQTVAATYSSINSLGLAPGLIGVAPNTATVDSVLSGNTATVRVYGSGGVGTSYTQSLGSQTMTLPAAQFTGQTLSTTYSLLYNTSSQTYLLTTGTSPSDSYIFIGSVTTVAAGGTGGSSGGGGRGGYACTVRGTLIHSDRGEESNESIQARFAAGDPVYLKGRNGMERLVRAEWVTVDRYELIQVDGISAFGCSESHTLLAEDAEEHRWCSSIEPGKRVDTLHGFRTMQRRTIHAEAEVLRIELAGADHEYVAAGVWTHNVQKASQP